MIDLCDTRRIVCLQPMLVSCFDYMVVPHALNSSAFVPYMAAWAGSISLVRLGTRFIEAVVHSVGQLRT